MSIKYNDQKEVYYGDKNETPPSFPFGPQYVKSAFVYSGDLENTKLCWISRKKV